MHKKGIFMIKLIFSFLLLFPFLTSAQSKIDAEYQDILMSHFNEFKDQEFFSGITLSIYIPKQAIKNYYVGKVSHDLSSKNISEDTLFEIGSITKSFTAALLLTLENDTFSLNNKLNDWLPQYPKWGTLSLRSLLNMTSGLPNYTDSPLVNAEEYKNIARLWSNQELMTYVYPKKTFSPPLKNGYFYTNTGYILLDLIIEKMTHESFSTLMENKILKPADLQNTFYPSLTTSKSIFERLAHGYNFNQYDNSLLVGRDMYGNNLSWAGAAGAMISNSEDIIHWVKTIFVENNILDASKKKQLTELISLNTGKPLIKPSKTDPRGFGLGVVQGYDPELKVHFWFYQGETLGFRAFYMYVPCNGVIISTILNSATNEENNHINKLIKTIYQSILRKNTELNCHS